MLVGLACAVLAAVLGSGCDDKMERQIGAMSAKSVEQEFRVVDDPLANQWLGNMGHSLVGQSMRQYVPYEFKIIDTDMVNAFAAPYGHVYVTTGLLDFADSEDEIWGVVGHEIGHVTYRHSMSSVKRGFLYQIGLAVLGTQNRSAADFGGIGLGLLALKYSRDNELQADDMGRTLAYGGGHDPRGSVEFFRRLKDKYEKKKPSSLSVMFATHPPTANRITRQELFPELSAKNPEVLLQTGRGYARRYQLKAAETMLTQAAQLAPGNASVLVALADVEMARGEYDHARTTLAGVPSGSLSRYAQARIQVASASVPREAEPASEAERQSALALLSEAQTASKQAAAFVESARVRTAGVAQSLAPTVAATNSILGDLMGLSDSDLDLGESTQKLVVYANSVVNRALDPVYSAEHQWDSLLETAQAQELTVSAVTRKLEAAREGGLAAGDVVALERALREATRGLEDAQTALHELEAAAPAIRKAQEAAADSTRYVERLVRGDRNPATARLGEMSARQTEARGLAALAATQNSKKLTERAALRSLVARINLAGAGAKPEAKASLDGLVGLSLMQRPGLVGQLRQEGLGYGDAAVLLATVQTTKADPVEFARLSNGVHSMVDQADAVGVQPGSVKFLLKYLAHAIEGEV